MRQVTTWSEGCGLSEHGIQVDGIRYSTEDLDEITSREDAEAADISTVLLDQYHGHWGLYGMWLEDRAVWGSPKGPRVDLHEFMERLKVRQHLISSAMGNLMRDTNSQPEPRSSLTLTGVVS